LLDTVLHSHLNDQGYSQVFHILLIVAQNSSIEWTDRLQFGHNKLPTGVGFGRHEPTNLTSHFFNWQPEIGLKTRSTAPEVRVRNDYA